MKAHTFEVVKPVGEPTAELGPLAPRPPDLSGKTVCEIWNGGFRGDVTFRMIEEMLRKRYPGVKVIPYTEFPMNTTPLMKPETIVETLDAVRTALVEKGCEALITGNGG